MLPNKQFFRYIKLPEKVTLMRWWWCLLCTRAMHLVGVIWGRCNLKCSRRTVIFLPVCKISSLKITLPETLQLKTLDFLQQTMTMNENAQWQMMKDSVLFALSSGFSVSLFHFYLKKKSTRGVLFCISSFFSLHRSIYLLLAYCLYWR
jgi:hypothetical protein